MATSNNEAEDGDEFRFSSDMTLEDIRVSHQQFCRERNWRKYHTPRNILLALVGEVGELSEIFQWKGEVKVGLPEFSEDEKKHVGEEISDVLIYLVDLASQCHIDLPAALFEKMQKNAQKHPTQVEIPKRTPKFDMSDLYTDRKNFIPGHIPERERVEGDGSE